MTQSSLRRQFTPDQRIVLNDRTWEQFKHIQKGFENSPGVRLFYFDETVEILMPGRDHEFFSRFVGYLVMTFLFEKGIRCIPTGSMTQEREGISSVQADESYCVGSPKVIPDLAIEIVLTSGGESKLPRYQALGVPEVWFWEDGVFALHHLSASGYERVDRSQLPNLQDLDIALLTRCVLIAETDELAALEEFRKHK
ncbi:Uma2 family endonuclease [Phormidesmis priestleyi]